jgi:hypothetical protein
MIAAFFGIPLAFLALIYFGGEGYKLVHDRTASTFFGLAVGICVYYVCRGADILEERKRDNPRSFDVPLDVGDVLNNLETLLKASRKGPYYWQIKEFSLEQAKLAAVLSFTEMTQGLFSQPMSLSRHMLLLATVEPWTDKLPTDELHTRTDNYFKMSDKAPLSRVTIKWEVDSFLSRSECDQHMDLLQNEIWRALEHPAPEPPQKPHPLMPPAWALGLLLAAALYSLDQYTKYDEAKARAEEIRQQRQEAWERVLDPKQHQADAEQLNRQQNLQMRRPIQYFQPPQNTQQYQQQQPATNNQNNAGTTPGGQSPVNMEPIVQPDGTTRTHDGKLFLFNKDGAGGSTR